MDETRCRNPSPGPSSDAGSVIAVVNRGTANEEAWSQVALERLGESAARSMSIDTQFRAMLMARCTTRVSRHTWRARATFINSEFRERISRSRLPTRCNHDGALVLISLHEAILNGAKEHRADSHRRAVLRHHLAIAQHPEVNEVVGINGQNGEVTIVERGGRE